MERKPLPVNIGPDNVSGAVKTALKAWPSGKMTPNQQVEVLSWILNDLCGGDTIDPIEMSERASGYANGLRRVRVSLARLAGVRTIIGVEEEK